MNAALIAFLPETVGAAAVRPVMLIRRPDRRGVTSQGARGCIRIPNLTTTALPTSNNHAAQTSRRA